MTSKVASCSALVFGAGLILILLDSLLFLLDWPHSGLAFCIGLAVCAVSAVLSERATVEDLLVLLAGALLLALIIVRSI